MTSEGSTASVTPAVHGNPNYLVDKIVDFKGKLEALSAFDLQGHYERCGWIPYFEVRDDIYYDEWLQFYKNAEIREDIPDMFAATVNGGSFRVHERSISKVIGCPREGLKVFSDEWKEESVMGEDKVPVTDRLIKETIFEEDAHNLEEPEATKMVPLARVLQKFHSHTVIPKHSSRARVRNVDKNVIFNVMQGKKINLPNLIYRNLRASILDFQHSSDVSKKYLIYGVLITKLLKHRGVNMGEQSVPSSKLQYLNVGAFKRMKGSVAEIVQVYTDIYMAKKGVQQKRKRTPEIGEGSSAKKKAKVQQPAETSEYVPPGHVKPKTDKPTFKKVIQETPSEAELYQKVKKKKARLHVPSDSEEYEPSRQVRSVQEQFVSESQTHIRGVLEDAQADVEHCVRVKEEARLRRAEQEEEVNQSPGSSRPLPVGAREGIMRTKKRKATNKATKMVVEKNGKVKVLPGPHAEEILQAVKAKRRARTVTPPLQPKITRNLFPESPSSPGSGIPPHLHETISNLVGKLVQDVQLESVQEAPLMDQPRGLSAEPVVENLEVQEPEAHGAESSQGRWHPPLAVPRNIPDPEAQLEDIPELVEDDRLQVYGVYFRTLSQIGTLTTLNSLYFYYPARGILILRFIFMLNVIHYVPLQYLYVVLDYIPQIATRILNIPRLNVGVSSSTFVPSQVWYTIRTSYFLDFYLSRHAWEEELNLRRAEYIRHVEYLVDIHRFMDRIFNERLRVLNVLAELGPSISSGDSFIDLS